MSKSIIAILTYILEIVFGALVLDIWNNETKTCNKVEFFEGKS